MLYNFLKYIRSYYICFFFFFWSAYLFTLGLFSLFYHLTIFNVRFSSVKFLHIAYFIRFDIFQKRPIVHISFYQPFFQGWGFQGPRSVAASFFQSPSPWAVGVLPASRHGRFAANALELGSLCPSDWGGWRPGAGGRVRLSRLGASCPVQRAGSPEWRPEPGRPPPPLCVSLHGPSCCPSPAVPGRRQRCPDGTPFRHLPRASMCGVRSACPSPSIAQPRRPRAAVLLAFSCLSVETLGSQCAGDPPPPFLGLSFLPAGIF